MGIRVGKDWRLVSSPRLCGTFLAATYDPASKRSNLLRFGSSANSNPITSSHFKSASIRDGEVYYVAEEGLLCRPLEADGPRLIFPAQKGFSLGASFISPDATVAFVLQTQTSANARGGSVLLRIDLASGKHVQLIAFDRFPEFIQIAWPKNCLFVSLHDSDADKRIDRIDLKTLERRVVLRSEILRGISLSENGDLIHWPLSDVGPIEECRDDGLTRTLTEFGWFPAVSKTGNLAFLMGDHTLWTAAPRGKISRTAFTWSQVNSGAMGSPSWCECGNHVAAMLSGAYRENWLARDLVIADLQRMEVSVFEQSILDPALNVGGQVWVCQ